MKRWIVPAFIVGFVSALALFAIYYGPAEVNQELGKAGEQAMWKVWEIAASQAKPNGPPFVITPHLPNATPLPQMTWLPITATITLRNDAGFSLMIHPDGQQECLNGQCKSIPRQCDVVGIENAILCVQDGRAGVLYLSPPWNVMDARGNHGGT